MSLVPALAQALYSLATPPEFEVAEPTHGERSFGREDLLADVYLPALPFRGSVVLVHGGGFLIGSRRMKPMRLLATRLSRAGFAVCVADYHLLLRGGTLGRAVDEVVEAVAWWRREAPALGLPDGPTSMVGLSAGGTLTLLAARRIESLHRVASIFGLHDLGELRGPLATLLPRLLLGTSDRTRWREASPLASTDLAVPLLLVHGGRDGLVPVAQHHALEEKRRAAGLPTRSLLFPEEPHAFLNRPSAATEETIEALARFLGEEPGP